MPLNGYLGDDRYYGYQTMRPQQNRAVASGGNSLAGNLGYQAAVASGQGGANSQDINSPQPNQPNAPQSSSTAVTPQQITGQLNGQMTQTPGGDQSPQQIQSYYTNSYAFEPSVQAPPVNAQWQNAPQPQHTLQPIGTVGANGVNSSTAPEILAAREASLAAVPNPNTPPPGAVPIPGSGGHYVTANGATWSPPSLAAPQNYDAWLQSQQDALRNDTPEVRTYLSFLRSNGRPLGYGNPATDAAYLNSYR